MLPTPDYSKPITMESLFAHIEEILLRTWCETGYGQLTIESQRVRQDKIRVILRGSTHYAYVIDDASVKGLVEVLKPLTERRSNTI